MKTIFRLLFIFLFAFIYMGCKRKCKNKDACNYDEKEECVLKPSGTVSTNMESGNGYTWPCFGNSRLGFSGLNFVSDGGCLGVGEIADMGSMTCVGGVTTKPASGYGNPVAAEIGHGYVFKSQDGIYARFYAEEWMKNTSGGVIGIKISYQSPF